MGNRAARRSSESSVLCIANDGGTRKGCCLIEQGMFLIRITSIDQ